MRYFILFGVPAIIAVILVATGIILYKEQNAPGTGTANNNLKAIGTGADAVRALDQILTDPTLIASSEWERNARDIVREWYGPRQLGR